MGKIFTRRRDLLLGSLFATFASAKSFAARMTEDKGTPRDRAEFFRRMFVPSTRLPGDHVFTPIGVPHGIENTSDEHHLKVFLTFIYR